MSDSHFVILGRVVSQHWCSARGAAGSGTTNHIGVTNWKRVSNWMPGRAFGRIQPTTSLLFWSMSSLIASKVMQMRWWCSFHVLVGFIDVSVIWCTDVHITAKVPDPLKDGRKTHSHFSVLKVTRLRLSDFYFPDISGFLVWRVTSQIWQFLISRKNFTRCGSGPRLRNPTLPVLRSESDPRRYCSVGTGPPTYSCLPYDLKTTYSFLGCDESPRYELHYLKIPLSFMVVVLIHTVLFCGLHKAPICPCLRSILTTTPSFFPPL